MDLRTYAVRSADGTIAWRSEPVAGVGFLNYYPVVWQNRVTVVPRKPYDTYPHSPEGEAQLPSPWRKHEWAPDG